MSRLTREEYEANTSKADNKAEDDTTNPQSVIYEPPRDLHGFRTDIGGNRKARRAAWARTRKIRARFEALTSKEAAR